MNFEEIKEHIKKKTYLFSEHADEERTKDKLTVSEIEEAILSGKVIEERFNDPRGESRLVAGRSGTKSIHVVVGVREEKPAIVTIYIPDKKLWGRGIIRKRKKKNYE